MEMFLSKLKLNERYFRLMQFKYITVNVCYGAVHMHET